MSGRALYNENDVLNALRILNAPYMNINVVAAGMIKNILISGIDLSFTLEMKIPAVPVIEKLEQEIRTALAKHIPELGTVLITPVTNIPGMDTSHRTTILPDVKNSIAVASGKGGVGKSTIAVNLAVALAESGARVGLLDADIYGPSIPMMMGVCEPPIAYQDNGKTRMVPIESHGVKVMSIGFLIDPEDAVIWRGPLASGALKQFLTDVDWGALDYLIFDMPPGTGDIQLTLSQVLPLTGAVIVTTPQDISLSDARKGCRMFERVGVPILGIIENMSYYICSHCGNRDEIFSYGGGRESAIDLNVPFLGEIPIVTVVRESGDKGIPIVNLAPESEIARCYLEAAMNMAGCAAESVLLSSAAPKIDIAP